jgi:small subunit ribosomal protein S2
LAIISVKNLLEAGVHFGHRASRWNPKMSPYIFGKRNLIHIINLRETVRGLIRAYHFLSKLTAEGQEVLFVGTKRQAKAVIKQEASRCKMHYVSERWLGGTLTNFETIRKRLARLEDLEKMEQDGSMDNLGKKLASSLRRQKKKINRNLEGIRGMTKLPGALVIVDPLKERNAVLEAIKLNIPTIALMDTDSDPELVDIPIPGNDDAMRSIEIVCAKLADAVLEGSAKWEENKRIEDRKRQEAAAARGEHGKSALKFVDDVDAVAAEKRKMEGKRVDREGRREVRKGRDGKRRGNAKPEYRKRHRGGKKEEEELPIPPLTETSSAAKNEAPPKPSEEPEKSNE